MLDDPDAATIYRVAGEPPFPDPAHPALPTSITPRHVTLRDRQTVATVLPFASRHQVPDSLLRYLNDQLNKEIEGGDTYPMMEGLPFEKFASYWFQNFGAIMLLGHIENPEDVVDGKDWSKECLGFFYIKPNYPGRSSHVCNAGFVVTDASRNRGVGRLLGESYLDWAPKLGYTYSVFNLVYETNVASCKIWDGLGFKRIGRVKGCGNLKSYPGQLIDAIIYGRDLGDGAGSSEDLVSEERFDKIKFYLKYGRYPNGADRAEKSRLRSAATHYKLLDGDVLMLKDKEVISDPQRQYDIARTVHNGAHAGINKTTALIAERYHWSRIKETVSDVIRNCAECKELGKTQSPSLVAANGVKRAAASLNTTSQDLATVPPPKRASPSPVAGGGAGSSDLLGAAPRSVPPLDDHTHAHLPPFGVPSHHYADPADMSVISPSHTLRGAADVSLPEHGGIATTHDPMLQDQSSGPQTPHHAPTSPLPLSHAHNVSVYQPIDPQIISQPSSHAHHHPLHYAFHTTVHHHHPEEPHHHHHHSHSTDTDTFQALLNATDEVDPGLGSHHAHHHHHHSPSHDRGPEDDETDQAAVDRDLEMLIEPQDDDDDDNEDDDANADANANANANDVDEPSAMHVDMADPVTGEHGKAGAGKMDVSALLSSAHDVEDEDEARDVTSERERGIYGVGFGRHLS